MQSIEPSFLPELIAEVLYRIEQRLSNTDDKQLTTEEFIELNSLFQEEVVTKAFHIIDTHSIISYHPESGTNELIEIAGVWPSQFVYKLFPDINFCHCPFFKEQILNSTEASCYTCEHVLAARLARILHKLKVEILPKHKFNFILKQIAVED